MNARSMITLAVAATAFIATHAMAYSPTFADEHVKRKIGCNVCHQPAPPKVNEQACKMCHNVDALAAKKPVHAMVKANPKTACNMCHKNGHKNHGAL